MSLVYVQYTDICVNSYRGEGSYADWSTTNDFTVEGVTLDNKHRWGYDAIQIAQNVKVGDRVWVLWMTYSDGDSFGSASGKGEVLWVFTDPVVGDNALQKLQALDTRHATMFDFEDEDGETLHLANPANDYFSRVEQFYLTAHTVGDCPASRY